jgi:hypothetical protein
MYREYEVLQNMSGDLARLQCLFHDLCLFIYLTAQNWRNVAYYLLHIPT